MSGEELAKISNEYHEAFCEYVEEFGFDTLIKLEAEVKIQWLKLMAKRNGIELDTEY